MARIRTVKPEFFTSEDVVGLTPFARLLYIALWCEADKEGRLVWKPKTFKMRYFPADPIDMDGLCSELLTSGLVVLYGEGLAYVPTFTAHQHINPRETASQLPAPPARQPRVLTRQPRVSDAQGGREGKGKEGNARQGRKTSIPDGFAVSERVHLWAKERGYTAHQLDAGLVALTSYAKRKGATYVDWDEALMTAVRDDWGKVGKAGGDDPLAGAINA